MPRKLSSSATLDNLKREAKRWLRAIRANDPHALARLRRVIPDPPAELTLRSVQHALAREFDLSGWSDLTRKVGTVPAEHGPGRTIEERFFHNACPDHHVRGPWMHVFAHDTAKRMLARHP